MTMRGGVQAEGVSPRGDMGQGGHDGRAEEGDKKPVLHLVPIPVTLEHLRATEPFWFPFIERISRYTGVPVSRYFEQVMEGEVQPFLVWDGRQAHALCGVRFYMRDSEKIAEWVWATGRGRQYWEHLLPDMEETMRFYGAAVCQPVCRKGWSRFLGKHGYEIVGYRDGHIIMEKRLWTAEKDNKAKS